MEQVANKMVDSKQRRLHRNLEDPGEGQGSGAHMISTARVPADKPVRIAFSLDNASDDTPSEDAIPLVFPELDQQLQPLPPCHDSAESMQVFKQHCQIAEEYNEVKKEIALLEERNSKPLVHTHLPSLCGFVYPGYVI
ncbi:MAP3K7 C-terminal-like protein isoform X3 [Mustela erminea]|uniref:MAP3K7 C-terminal-like protein isoform X3 n=1 Tax=Mustela erminea TaxID=36723 RepID=UPI0013869668|nr:MAP3K7 C-terminal-like protein isoform X3 [Mustela erminea]